ncbi:MULTISPECIES: hypothetical protein [unclassified Streptomyces]|uniref:hypothetical protein n=1 Tax=unclassified Streptomyces TaxID=2593676 RepID=UPI003322F497
MPPHRDLRRGSGPAQPACLHRSTDRHPTAVRLRLRRLRLLVRARNRGLLIRPRRGHGRVLRHPRLRIGPRRGRVRPGTLGVRPRRLRLLIRPWSLLIRPRQLPGVGVRRGRAQLRPFEWA